MERLERLPAESNASSLRERQLVSEVLRKDRKATAEFVALCADWIYPFVWRRVAPRIGIIEDLMQDIFLAAWQNLSSFRGDASLKAWILGIARHKVEDYYRKRIREAEPQETEAEGDEARVLPQFAEQLDVAAQQTRISRTLSRMREAYALALIWRHREGKSVREMAELTGKTEKAIERLLARARESFKRSWNDGQH